MEKWYSELRNLKDEYENGYKVEEFCHYMWHSLHRLKVKDKGKFHQRMGPEFVNWSNTLLTQFPEEMVKDVVNNDEFWQLTLQLAKP